MSETKEEIFERERKKRLDEFALTDGERKVTRAPGITWYNTLYTGILKDNLIDVASSDIEDLRLAAEEWHKSKKVQENFIAKKIMPILDHFAFKTVLVIVQVFAKVAFYNFINNRNEDFDDDDDDDDRDRD